MNRKLRKRWGRLFVRAGDEGVVNVIVVFSREEGLQKRATVFGQEVSPELSL